ncbi:MAG: PRC-barrel domain-containing protein [Ktedonobacterales bacterium]
MRADILKGRAVVTLANAARIGHIDDVLHDADDRTVLGFLVKAGALHRAEGLPHRSARAIGADAITVDDHSAVNSLDHFSELAGAPQIGVEEVSRVGDVMIVPDADAERLHLAQI